MYYSNSQQVGLIRVGLKYIYIEIQEIGLPNIEADPSSTIRVIAYGTVRYGTLRYGTLRYGTVRYGTGTECYPEASNNLVSWNG